MLYKKLKKMTKLTNIGDQFEAAKTQIRVKKIMR